MIPKYRVWDKTKEQMYDVRLLSFKEGELVRIESRDWVHDLADCVLMQSTGLKDRNGVEVFEGDVLLVPNEYEDITVAGRGPTFTDNYLLGVLFKNGAFGIEITERHSFLRCGFYSLHELQNEIGELAAAKVEVIGNRFANHSLLTEGERR